MNTCPLYRTRLQRASSPSFDWLASPLVACCRCAASQSSPYSALCCTASFPRTPSCPPLWRRGEEINKCCGGLPCFHQPKRASFRFSSSISSRSWTAIFSFRAVGIETSQLHCTVKVQPITWTTDDITEGFLNQEVRDIERGFRKLSQSVDDSCAERTRELK